MPELSGLSGEAHELALSRFRLLEPHLEHGRELRSVAAGAGVSFRTLQRWVAQYRSSGLAALARKPRADRGERRAVSPKIREVIEGLALERPLLPIRLFLPNPSKRSNWLLWAVLIFFAHGSAPEIVILIPGDQGSDVDRRRAG
jgi:transposase-like protein